MAGAIPRGEESGFPFLSRTRFSPETWYENETIYTAGTPYTSARTKYHDRGTRSEERRVGKECRCTWRNSQNKKRIVLSASSHNCRSVSPAPAPFSNSLRIRSRCASTCGPSSPSGVFFFQAEDGIRDDLVTGVQTCALPIS